MEAEPPFAGPSPVGAVSLCLLLVSPLGLNPLKAAIAPPSSQPRPHLPGDPAHRRCPCISAATAAGGDRPAAAGTGLSGFSHLEWGPWWRRGPLLMCFAYALHKQYPWWEFKDLSPPLLELEFWCSQRKGLLCIPRREGAGGRAGAAAKVRVLRATCSLGLGEACHASQRAEGQRRALEKWESPDAHPCSRWAWDGGRKGDWPRDPTGLAPEAQRADVLPGGS